MTLHHHPYLVGLCMGVLLFVFGLGLLIAFARRQRGAAFVSAIISAIGAALMLVFGLLPATAGAQVLRPAPPFDYTAAAFWFDVLQWCALIALGIWGYLRTKDNDNASALKAVADQLADFIGESAKANESQNNRLTALEASMQHMPTDEELGHIREAVASTKARVEGMGAQLARIEHQTNIIHEHLLRSK